MPQRTRSIYSSRILCTSLLHRKIISTSVHYYISERAFLLLFFLFLAGRAITAVGKYAEKSAKVRKAWLNKKNRSSLPAVLSHEAGKCGRLEVLKRRVLHTRATPHDARGKLHFYLELEHEDPGVRYLRGKTRMENFTMIVVGNARVIGAYGFHAFQPTLSSNCPFGYNGIRA